MLIYHLNNILILFWAAIFCFHKPSKIKNLIFIILAFSQLLAISIMRYKIGYDYNMYATGFFNMRLEGFETLTYKDWEIGFIFLTKILGLFLPNFFYYMAFFSVLSLVPAAIFIYKNSEVPWISTVLYVNTFLFFMTMNFMRQAVAVSLVMLSWHFIKKKKFIPFLIVILIASLFHQTVLIMIPIYFIIKMKIKPQGIIIYAYLLLLFYISSKDLINILTKFFHEEYNRSIFVTEGISFVYAILPLVISIIAFILSKSTIDTKNEKNKYIINMTIITALFFITAVRHGIIERLSYYTLIFTILLVPVIYNSIKQNGIKISSGDSNVISITTERSKKVAAVIILLVILAISYLSFYYGLNENAHGVVPYNTWYK